MKRHANAAFAVDKRDSNGTTLLMECARQGTYQRLLQCLDEGSDINAVDYAGNNALMYAIQGGQHEMATLLLGRGIDAERKNALGATPLIEAAGAKVPEIVERLLQKKVAVNVQNNNGNTALMMACAAGDGWAACRLVDAGAEAETILNKQGNSAMALAQRLLRTQDFTKFKAVVEKNLEKRRVAEAVAAEKKQEELAQSVRDAVVLQRNVVPLKPVAFRRKDS